MRPPPKAVSSSRSPDRTACRAAASARASGIDAAPRVADGLDLAHAPLPGQPEVVGHRAQHPQVGLVGYEVVDGARLVGVPGAQDDGSGAVAEDDRVGPVQGSTIVE